MSTEGLSIEGAVQDLRLVDHHVHGAGRHPLTRLELEGQLTESDRPIPAWMTQFDSQLGLAVRRWCAPVLDLEPLAGADCYVRRRIELGPDEVNRRFLSVSGVGHYLVETGFGRDQVLSPVEMAAASGAESHEVVRLERVFEELAMRVTDAIALVEGYPNALAQATMTAKGLKSIIAYRHGFDFDPARPSRAEVVAAAGEWISGRGTTGLRLDHPVLLRHVLWIGVDRGLPIQLHAGYGDPDLDLRRCDPLLLTDFIRLVEEHGVPLVLLHCYPFHRNAGYLAQVFPHVFFDVGLAVNYTGLQSYQVVAESLELTPFAKLLFSSDAWGPPELHFLGALLWRRALVRVLRPWVEAGDCSADDAVRIAGMIGHDNAHRLYGLGEAR